MHTTKIFISIAAHASALALAATVAVAQSGSKPTSERSTAPDRASPAALPNSQEAGKATAMLQYEAAQKRGRELLAAHPEIEGLLMTSRRPMIVQHYAGLYRELGLGPEQVEKLEVLLMQRASVGQLLTGADGQMVVFAFAAETPGNRDQPLNGLLGEAGFKKFKDYERARYARTLVIELAASLYVTNSPLAPGQTEPLTQAVAGASSQFKMGRVAGRDSVDWDAACRELKDVLTPPQFAVFKAMAAREQASCEINRIIQAEGKR